MSTTSNLVPKVSIFSGSSFRSACETESAEHESDLAEACMSGNAEILREPAGQGCTASAAVSCGRKVLCQSGPEARVDLRCRATSGHAEGTMNAGCVSNQPPKGARRTFRNMGGVAKRLTWSSLAATRSRSFGYSEKRSLSVCKQRTQRASIHAEAGSFADPENVPVALGARPSDLYCCYRRTLRQHESLETCVSHTLSFPSSIRTGLVSSQRALNESITRRTQQMMCTVGRHHVGVPQEVLRPLPGVDEVLAVVIGVTAGGAAGKRRPAAPPPAEAPAAAKAPAAAAAAAEAPGPAMPGEAACSIWDTTGYVSAQVRP